MDFIKAGDEPEVVEVDSLGLHVLTEEEFKECF